MNPNIASVQTNAEGEKQVWINLFVKNHFHSLATLFKKNIFALINELLLKIVLHQN